MAGSKKVLGIVGYTFLPTRTGGHRGIDDVYQAVSLQYEVYVLSTKENKPDKEIGYTLVDNLGSEKDPYRYINPRLYRKVLNLINEYEIDIVQIDHPYLGWLAHKLRKNTDVALYVRCHNLEFQRFRQLGKRWWPIMEKYEKYTYSLADKTLYVSPDDLTYVQENWGLENGVLMTFGTWQSEQPSKEEKQACREYILQEQNLPADTKLINFNGPMDYFANKDALQSILTEIAPAVSTRMPEVHIILCGSGFPEEYRGTLEGLDNVSWAGFVDDLEIYLKGSDQFWNPIRLGGGIKTKLVQALSLGLTVISYESGALGMLTEACGPKLQQVSDGNWEDFASRSAEYIDSDILTPESFYQSYYWPHVIQNAGY